ncbi:MAG: ATP-binding cassette domain-containing protein [Pseudomonadota bacterium]
MIETQSLRKDFGRFTAVRDISFRVDKGEVLGFLGPNGAGKSTTMKMIAGFLAPTSGRASVCGHDVVSEPMATKRAIGYLPEGAPSYDEMTPRAFLNFIADVRGLSGAERAARIDDVIGRLALERVLEQSIETLSKGYKRRVGLAQAILHDPAVLILDEPTDGLDPNQKHEVRALIRDIAKDKTIVISTHILEEVHAVCTRAVIIADGAVLADDTPAGLEARSKYHNAVRLSVDESTPLDSVKDALRSLRGVASLETGEDGSGVIALPKPDADLFTEISTLVRDQNWGVTQIEKDRGRLDDVFRSITTEKQEAARG